MQMTLFDYLLSGVCPTHLLIRYISDLTLYVMSCTRNFRRLLSTYSNSNYAFIFLCEFYHINLCFDDS